MASSRTGFQLEFEEISPGNPRLGTAAVIPWDSDTFGFPVAACEISAADLDDAEANEFVRLLHEWLTRRGVAVCSSTVGPADTSWRSALDRAGFRFVDMTLEPSLAGLQTAHLPKCRFPVRAARPEDGDAIRAIAATSFVHGRYHADPLFPRELANLRYRNWVSRALSSPGPEDSILVLEQGGRVRGFFHVVVSDSSADLRLVAVSEEVKSTIIGFELYVATLHEMRRRGIQRVTSVISATNTAVLNVHAKLGFRFDNCRLIYHWHSGAAE